MSHSFGAEGYKEVELEQGRIRYRECGSGRPVLFVHGFLVDGNLWRKPVAELSGGLRCIVPDWPLGSHRVPMKTQAAQSPRGVARLVVEFMDALGLDEVVLVGNDSGGAICQLVVAHHPERISHLVLTPCDAYENFPPKLFRYLKWLGRIPGGVFVVVQGLRVGALRRLPIAFGWAAKRPIDSAVVEGYLAPSRSCRAIRRDIASFIRNISARELLEASHSFARFEKPVLLVWPKEDRIFPFGYAERLAADFPHARLEAISNSYTFVAEDQPVVLAGLIRDFLASTADRAREHSSQFRAYG